jgi:Ras-related protein Rab-21
MIVPRPKSNSPSFKVVLLGDTRVGKTSLLARKTGRDQFGNQKPTVGSHCTDLAVRVGAANVMMQVWDTAGQEMYRALVPVYLREARAAFMVFDLTDEDSFQGIIEWYTMLNDTVRDPIPVYLIGNKIDLAGQIVVADETAEEFAANHKAKFRKVSALTGHGVEALFLELAEDFVNAGFPMEKWKSGMVASQSRPCVC